MTSRRNPACSCLRYRTELPIASNDSGMTLIELLVSMMVLALAMAMTLVIVHTVTTQVYGTVAGATATDAAQIANGQLDPYVRDAVTPLVAAAANGSSVANVCWGSSTIQQLGGVPGVSYDSPSTFIASSTMEPFGVLVAHDYNMILCAYQPGTSTPHIYQINLTSCKDQSANGSGDCTLEVVDCGTSFVPADLPLTSYVNCPGGGGQGQPQVVYSQPNVWCDNTCQSDVTSENSEACPANYPTAGTSTPPLFTYEDTGQDSLGKAWCSGDHIFDPTTSVDGTLSLIQHITLNFTILSNSNLLLPINEVNGSPGTQITDDILLANLINPVA